MRGMQLGAELPDPLSVYAAVDRSAPPGRCWVLGHMVSGLDGCAAVGGRVGVLSTAPDAALFKDENGLLIRNPSQVNEWASPQKRSAELTHTFHCVT